ncbi:recombinase family protein [Microbacterium testaceum]|uniref:recombinase family protein n=1 Tax=Microbacterium testaceum TaxID=2033 RepID=UPI0024351BBD|nr:recombinase family protein [Microbacterium testaceum]
MTTPTIRRAVLYCRISRTKDESVSLERQERDLRKLCELEGWEVTAVIVDDGKSGTKDRDGAARALDLLRSGEADTLLVWAFDRWSRQGLRAVADLIDVLKERKRALFFAKKDGLRSDAQAWRIVASVLAEVAAMEAENTSARILAARSEHLSKTGPEEQRFLGGKAPFGYRAVDNPHGPGRSLAVDPYEAEIVRTVAERLIDGEYLSSVTVWLDANAVPTPQSEARRARQADQPVEGVDRGSWRVTTVRNLWRSETLIGRTTRRVPVLASDGEPIVAADGTPRLERRVVSDAHGLPITRWEPVLDLATFQRLQARLPSVGRVQPRRTVSWLTGIARCASCNGKLYAQKRRKGDREELFFRCAATGDALNPCTSPGHVSVARLEQYIEGKFLAFAGSLPMLKEVQRSAPAYDALALAAVTQAIADATAAMQADGADYSQLVPRLDQLKARRREVLSATTTHEVELVPTGRTLGDVWRDLADDLDAKREHLQKVIVRVAVSRVPGLDSRAPLDRRRIEVGWNRDRGIDIDEPHLAPTDYWGRIKWADIPTR